MAHHMLCALRAVLTGYEHGYRWYRISDRERDTLAEICNDGVGEEGTDVDTVAYM